MPWFPHWKDTRFWILAICHGTAVLAALMAFVHQVPYAVDQGIARMAAAASLAAMGFSGLLGQFFYAWWLVLLALAGAITGIVSMKRHQVDA